MNQVVLEIKDLNYSYHSPKGETEAVKDLSFQLYESEFLSVIGPSGCGKSTLLSLLSGLYKPESGQIYYYNSESLYPNIGYMMQNDQLFEWLTIYKNAILGLELNKKLTKENEDFVLRLLEDYDLMPFINKYPSELSGGMRKRVSLIRTLALNPDILLLDEPFGALDYQTRIVVSDDICTRIKKTGKTVILITHDLSEAISLSNRILVLSKRPAKVKEEIIVNLTREGQSVASAREATEFPIYFKKLWRLLQDE